MTHVLIVEDREENRTLLKMLLVANGYRVTVAGDGMQALDAARRDRPDVIVSDVQMPNMDGFTLCRHWMQDAALRAIPFIFYSGTYVRADDQKLAFALGAVRYLIKPVETAVFLEELRQVLKHWAGRDAPELAAPLDDATSHALHGQALARKLEDKMAQLEAVNRQLRASEEKYRRIYENLQDVYVEARLDGTILEMSPKVATLSKGQYKSEDLVGTSVDALYADAPYGDAIQEAIRQRGQAIDVKSVFRNRDGSLVPCSVSAAIVRGVDGELKTAATWRDITGRSKTDREPVDDETQFRSLLEQWFTGIVVIQDQRLAYCNPRAAEILGYASAAELIDKDPSSISAARDVAAAAEALGRMLEKEEGPVSCAFVAARQDGSIIELELQGIRGTYLGQSAILGVIQSIAWK
ncbi:MAG: hypothetical protein A3G26_00190 [Betaproteobacteria bacterium RIFCSPLOWO2_12_FULL_65_110]|nr:MAG: hypothetical protein A3G26_00190 [Betaproteobacteria bacterium RIFCSPLOWO2_12_FULL_65_110]